jgi:hypothetical protein
MLIDIVAISIIAIKNPIFRFLLAICGEIFDTERIMYTQRSIKKIIALLLLMAIFISSCIEVKPKKRYYHKTHKHYWHKVY